MATNKGMQVTGTGIAVALAVVVALGFLFFGSALFMPFATDGSSASLIPGEQSTTIPYDGTLMVTDTQVGTGAEATPGTTVTVNYVGTLENGQVFDASANHGQPFTFVLGAGQVIAGWEQGIAGMKVGGTRTLVIPPELGYGAQAVGPIPANSVLIFEVELLEVR